MRVLLINPFYPISETPSPPLGLAYLGAALEQAGVQVKVLDYVVYPYRHDALESVLKEFKPHVAGATAVSMTFDHAKQILRDVKTIDPQILTVMGGPHVTFCERQTLANLRFHQINIADDLFTANQNHCLAVCEEILRRNLEINWTAFARVDTVSERLLSKMKAAGCTAVSFGIESANPAILNTIKKGITVQQTQDAVRKCLRVGISPYGSFILGLPGETPETIKETTAFAANLQQEGLAYGFHILAPFPGTEVREQSNRLGIRILTDDWSRYDANRAVSETASVNHRMLDAVVVDWEIKYNQYLEHIHKSIQNATSTEDEIKQLENLENTVALYDLMMKNQIEESGSLSLSARGSVISKEKGLEILMDRITGSSDMDPQKLKTALQHAIEKQDLELNDSAGRVEWEWRSFLLPAQKVPKMTKVS
jgi:radical SAM superfamily enzyme YgiQ (UPF0313 family)